uniref:Uncharacterized protein n=1 Tax=Anguilla anguilla TaxID=7936 RepID=A0A0E9R5I3_ANGAN
MTDRCGSHSCGLTAGCFRRFRKKKTGSICAR